MSHDIRPILRKPWVVYKLTDQNMRTYGDYQWALGEEKTASGQGTLCGPGWLHVYSDPRVAVLLNPLHAAIASPRLFRAHAAGWYRSDGSLKAGVSSLTLVEELPLPVYQDRAKAVFAIYCAQQVLVPGTVPVWDAWASEYLKGPSCLKAIDAAYAAADATPAAYTTSAVAYATSAASYAAYAAGAVAYAASVASYAADAAADAASAAATSSIGPFSLRVILDRVDAWVAAQ